MRRCAVCSAWYVVVCLRCARTMAKSRAQNAILLSFFAFARQIHLAQNYYQLRITIRRSSTFNEFIKVSVMVHRFRFFAILLFYAKSINSEWHFIHCFHRASARSQSTTNNDQRSNPYTE